MFNAPGTNDQDMLSFNIPDYSQVKRVNGTQQGFNLGGLIFRKSDGTQIEKVETISKPYGAEFVLEYAEEIIGIFGKTDGS